MIEFLQNFHFLRPWMLLFLVIPIGLLFKHLSLTSRGSSWENICDKNLLDFLLVADKTLKKISVKKYIYTGLIAMILAAAGPAWKKVEVPTFEVENPAMIILSLAKDMQLTDVTPSRLERAKFMISDITENIPEGQFGLEVYSQEPYIITPLTEDVQIIKSLLPQIVPNIVPDNGDRLDRAIALALERFKAAGYAKGNIVIFASDVGQRLDLALDKIKEAEQMNYTINIADTSYSGNEKLQMLAEKGNGVYFKVKDGNMQIILDKLRIEDKDKMTLSQNLRSNYLDYGYYLVFISLLCMLPFFRRGLLVLIFCCCFVGQANAGFLLNDNQEGFRLFNEEQYEAALEKFKDSVWRGISLYKLEKNEEALQEFSKEQSETAIYNAGVVLTKLCKYDKALSAFNAVLKQNPNNEDAAYNKQVLEELFVKAKEKPELLNCQNQQQDNQNNQQDQDNQQEQNNQNQSSNQNNDNQQNQDDSEQEQQQQGEQNQQSENNQQNNSDNQQQNNEQKQSTNENQANQPQDNANQNDQQQNGQEQQNENNSSGSNGSSENQDNANNPSSQKSDNKPDENNDTPTEADNDNGDENKSQNENGENNNGTEAQTEDQDVGLMNAKQGNEDTQYDDKVLAVRRKYREIPEDVGGLLREFIKKEHLKGRYRNEN